MNTYETVFILTPVLSEKVIEEAVNKYSQLLTDSGAKVKHVENWGMRRLAYPIQKKSNGFYHLFEFEADGDTIDKLEVALKRDERVLRFLTVRLDKYAQEWAEKRRVRIKEKKSQKA